MSIKVIIADDSMFLRKKISDILLTDNSINIIGYASNGKEAVEMVKDFHPNVLLLDLLMPEMNGLDAFERIMNNVPTPTIILSSISPQTMDASIQALLMGAFDYIIKPSGLEAKDLPKFQEELINKVHSASQSQIKKVYESDDLTHKKMYLRQELVNDTFKFGEYLNKLEPIDKSIDTEEKTSKPNDSIIVKSKRETILQEEPKIPKIINNVDKKDQVIPLIAEADKNFKVIPEEKSESKLKYDSSNQTNSIIEKKITLEHKVKNKNKLRKLVLVKNKKEFNELNEKKSRLTGEQKYLKAESVLDSRIISDVYLTTNIIVLGASVGGPRTLRTILKEIPKDLSCPLLIVQHLNANFINTFVNTLRNDCSIKIKVAEDGELIQSGIAYISPGEKHMEISIKNGIPHIKTYIGTPIHHCIPSIDVLFYSAARIYRNRAMGIILTGMGEDGVEGLRAIKNNGGRTIAESEETCVLYGMPKFAANRGYADFIIPNYEVKNYIMNFAKFNK